MTNPVTENTGAPSNVAPTPQSNPATAAGGDYTTATKISSMSDLKNKAPKVYDAMVQGIMTNIIKSNQRSLERFKKINQQGRQNG